MNIGRSLLVALALAAVRPLAAQPACGADSMYRRLPIYTQVVVERPADTLAASSLAIIAEAVATHVRVEVGRDSASVPRADSVIVIPRPGSGGRVWENPLDSAGVRVVMRRDRTVSWAPLRSPAVPATQLLLHALEQVRDAGDLVLPGESFVADTLPFTLGYYVASVRRDGLVYLERDHPPTLQAFTLRLPIAPLAGFAEPVALRHPAESRQDNHDARVTLQFVIDTKGRAEMSTVRDLWPKDQPAPTGERAAAYARFVDVAREGVRRATYIPAEVGGCRVRERVTQRFDFTLTKE